MSLPSRAAASATCVARAARALLATLAAATLLALPAGCGEPGEEVCDAVCDCIDCSERERDRCLAEQSAEADIASVYDCDAELEDYQSCVVSKADCPGGMFNANECTPELDEYQTCKD
jgi:hypothetical protein